MSATGGQLGTKNLSELFSAYAFTLDVHPPKPWRWRADRAVYAYGGEGTLALLAADLEFEGSRVKSPVTGRDFNPMGRGDGAYYAQGAFAIRGAKAALLGEITSGFGNSVCNGEAVPTALDLGGSPVHGAHLDAAGECCGKPAAGQDTARKDAEGGECKSRTWFTYPYRTIRIAVSESTATSMMEGIHAGKYSYAGMQDCAIGAWCDRGCCYVQITVPVSNAGIGSTNGSALEGSEELEEYIIRAASGGDGYFFGGPGTVPIAPPRDPGFDLDAPAERWRRRTGSFETWPPGSPNPFEPEERRPPRPPNIRAGWVWQQAYKRCYYRACLERCNYQTVKPYLEDEARALDIEKFLTVDIYMMLAGTFLCFLAPPQLIIPLTAADIGRQLKARNLPYDPWKHAWWDCVDCLQHCEEEADRVANRQYASHHPVAGGPYWW